MPMRRPVFTAFGIVVCFALAGGLACSGDSTGGKKVAGKMAEKMMEKALDAGGQAGHDVDLAGGGSVDLSGLPEGLRYPGAVAVARVAAPEGSGGGTTYIMKVDDPPSQVVGVLKKYVAGWTTVAAIETPQMQNFAYDSPDGEQRVAFVCGQDRKTGKTTLSITISPAPH